MVKKYLTIQMSIVLRQRALGGNGIMEHSILDTPKQVSRLGFAAIDFLNILHYSSTFL